MKKDKNITDVAFEKLHHTHFKSCLSKGRMGTFFFMLTILFMLSCNKKQEHIIDPQTNLQDEPPSSKNVEYIFKGKVLSEAELLQYETTNLILVSQEPQGGKVSFQVFDNDADFIAWASGTHHGGRLIAGHKAWREAARLNEGETDVQLDIQQKTAKDYKKLEFEDSFTATLYSADSCRRDSVLLMSPTPYKDLRLHKFDNKARSVYNNTPLWLALFENYNFNSPNKGIVMYIRAYQKHCTLYVMNNKISSARFF